MTTYQKVIHPVNCKFGAPMGRGNKGSYPLTVTSGKNNKALKKNQVKVYDRAVPLIDGAYDKGGAYWGAPNNLRVEYTKDLTYIKFYRT